MRDDEEMSEVHDELSLLMVRLSSLDQLDQAVEEPDSDEEPTVSLQASDRFVLKEVCRLHLFCLFVKFVRLSAYTLNIHFSKVFPGICNLIFSFSGVFIYQYTGIHKSVI